MFWLLWMGRTGSLGRITLRDAGKDSAGTGMGVAVAVEGSGPV